MHRTGGELEEEPFLNTFQDLYGDGTSVFPFTYGPVKMHTGDTHHIEGPHGEDGVELNGRIIEIFLRERDAPGELRDGYESRVDDKLGGITIWDNVDVPEDVRLEPPVREGSYEVFLPPRRGMVGGDAIRRYKLYYDIYFNRDSPVQPTRPYFLQLESIECHDAQEYADRVFIKVNGEKVWGPKRMQTHDLEQIQDAVSPIPIGANTIIALWEKDTVNRNDFFGEFNLRVEENFDFGHSQTHTYHPDSSISGTARYSLQYRVIRRD